MKLRNKKTGEIVEVESLYLTQTQELYLNYINEENKQKVYITDKIASFNLDWEDYEEPKVFYVVDLDGEILPSDFEDKTIEKSKELGNYFETKKEAELAVCKLKAWKRLKDKGFRFTGYDSGHNANKELCGQAYFKAGNFWFDIKSDLELLFGGEE